MLHEYPYSIKRHGTTLEKCEDEPVQTPGCIQGHGVLLVLRQSDLTVLQASENSRAWLGSSPEELLGRNVAFAVGESATEQIRHALGHARLDKVPLYLTTIQAGDQKNVRSLHVSLHTHLGLALLELEEATASGAEPQDPIRVDPDYYGLVRQTLTRFQEASSLKLLSHAITEELRRITELDRVMVYYFHADYSGEVIAESKWEDQTSWLGWRYPSHDIPHPAREIFKKIWSRPVPDVRAELFEMVPLLNPDTQGPLDMTYCSLRGASVMYTEYLDNMGVRAAFTLPLMREGELWGLIACHHNTPKLIPYRIRAASEFLARAASQQLRRAEELENADYRDSLEQANHALIAKVALAPDLSAFTEGPVHLGSGLDCGGAAIFCHESWNKVGQTPHIEDMVELGRWLLTQPACQADSPNSIFVTDYLSEVYPAAKDFADVASGLMAFCFSRDPLGLVFFFKPETLQTLTWAGNPNELPILEGPRAQRLSPRKSFELWRETVSHRSLPWKRIEADAMLNLRGLIIDLLVSRAEQLNTLRLRVAERTRELEKSRAHLAAQAAELTRSNKELEQFAYAASHDMREPLRAVTGFAQILKRNHHDKLDKAAQELIGHIVEGGKRMANLIDDLLALSSIGSKGKPFENTPLDKPLGVALESLSVAIRERSAVVRHGALPTLPVDASQVALLFQNLIGNAVKFCRDRTPEIHIGATRAPEGSWTISIRDNGIGIEPKYFERIFEMFQRLHTRHEYEGTGIGLAICKKIVGRHGGRIWLESKPGEGTSFYFTLPERHETHGYKSTH